MVSAKKPEAEVQKDKHMGHPHCKRCLQVCKQVNNQSNIICPAIWPLVAELQMEPEPEPEVRKERNEQAPTLLPK